MTQNVKSVIHLNCVLNVIRSIGFLIDSVKIRLRMRITRFFLVCGVFSLLDNSVTNYGSRKQICACGQVIKIRSNIQKYCFVA